MITTCSRLVLTPAKKQCEQWPTVILLLKLALIITRCASFPDFSLYFLIFVLVYLEKAIDNFKVAALGLEKEILKVKKDEYVILVENLFTLSRKWLFGCLPLNYMHFQIQSEAAATVCPCPFCIKQNFHQ